MNNNYTVLSMLRQVQDKCNDNIDEMTLINYLNEGITSLNAECGLRLPVFNLEVDSNSAEESVKKSLGYCIDEYTENLLAIILVYYMCYCVKQAEGYETAQNPFLNEYISKRNYFISAFKQRAKEEYQIPEDENGALAKGKFKKLNLRIRNGGLW